MSADVYERLKKEGIEVKFFINSSRYYSLGANNSRTRFYSKPVSPEYVYDEVVKVRGMDIVFVTTAKTNEEALDLLKGFGLPFKK